MTKRSLLMASAIWLAAGCGSDAPSISDEDGQPSDSGRGPKRDAGDDDPDAELGTGIDPAKVPGAERDTDEDGFSPAQGDCDDADPQTNPGAYDFPTNSIDEDCDGEKAKANDSCDSSLAIDSSDPEDAARALGLCKFVAADDKAWGVVSARFTDSTGTGKLSDPRAVGLLPGFGAAKPGAGGALLALSSGVARAPGQPGYTEDCDHLDAMCLLGGFLGCSGGGSPPDGYPKETSSCRAQTSIFSPDTKVFNQAALELQIRVPTNASSFAFDSIFYTYEYPKYVCSKFNDFFVVLKEPKPAELPDSNIVFDSNNDSIGVNTGLLAVCDPAVQDPDAEKRFDCAQGTSLLVGTGYGPGETTCADAGGAATGWLHTTAPVQGGEIITLRFAIWDTGDAILDSTVLVDKFEWSTNDSQVGTIPILL